jgi:hypothetical protein
MADTELVEKVARAMEIAAVEATMHHPVAKMWNQLIPWLFPRLAQAALEAAGVASLIKRVEELETALRAITEVAPSLPETYKWSGQAEALFDAGLRHKSGKKPFDYLKSWLSMLRPFAYATLDNSWGEMEKLLCIVMRNYVRVAAASDQARSLLTGDANV